MKQNYHRLLKRQLKKAGLDKENNPKLDGFLALVDQAYHEFNADFSHLENILEMSSQELYSTNKKLKKHVEAITGKLENVANNIQEVIFETDLIGNWQYLNPAWEKLTGYKVHDCLGHPFSNFIENLDERDRVTLNKLSQGLIKELNEIVTARTRDGEKKWLDVSIKLVHDQENNPTGYIGSIVDVTEQKNIQLALIEAKDKEMKANKAKDEFLSTISHEIRTPLNAVIGISHLLLLENPKESQIENLTALNYSSEHLVGLVNDILDFNKIESGNIVLEKSIFSLENILNAAESTFGSMAKEKNIKFYIERDNTLPRYLIGDSVRISQIITNLVGNAIKFTEKGSVTLKVQQLQKNQKNIKIKFDIIDTGIGIAVEKQDSIFDAFVQANSNTTRKFGGSGLGLAICKKLLQIMDTNLSLQSATGEGTTFSFTLDLKIHDGSSSKKNGAKPELSNLTALDGISVLVAEDNALNILVIKKFLSKWKVNFDIAENGSIAVEKAKQKNYDFILMDLQMPIMNGYEAAKRIRQSTNPHNLDIPIIALSASPPADVQNDIRKYGMDGHISKPFDPIELHQTLKRIKSLSSKIL
ncbi:response regulator [Flagellimonas sp. 389]|uniref:PAS domain-containing hybrid sensor histidine kinase/response regulator n=1 Tax=Flagellimonas sp. 389 TaxID=2835862 RepID=UPI001BD2D471|nr:ATP-binding protein [Flagellimonas sp. 389]MBS9461186.1 response regulator [Flagellimonas sp. 389]